MCDMNPGPWGDSNSRPSDSRLLGWLGWLALIPTTPPCPKIEAYNMYIWFPFQKATLFETNVMFICRLFSNVICTIHLCLPIFFYSSKPCEFTVHTTVPHPSQNPSADPHPLNPNHACARMNTLFHWLSLY